ncbi:hypothetical protein NWFMUON74_63010 [Nocardia wallacei]|uniref:Uncharacterized protein n=1 Tax=Nocardia wallacei TaxID=480035 RepID=A0A7G1KWY0_9NOCA|nr:hypothetical protein NWFMUON74_63010 [Nocardia wallacei]
MSLRQSCLCGSHVSAAVMSLRQGVTKGDELTEHIRADIDALNKAVLALRNPSRCSPTHYRAGKISGTRTKPGKADGRSVIIVGPRPV